MSKAHPLPGGQAQAVPIVSYLLAPSSSSSFFVCFACLPNMFTSEQCRSDTDKEFVCPFSPSRPANPSRLIDCHLYPFGLAYIQQKANTQMLRMNNKHQQREREGDTTCTE